MEAKVGDQRRRRGGAGSSRRVSSVITPEVPSEPTNNLVSDRPATSLSRGPAQPQRRAVGQHDLHAEHVVGGDAVLHAAQAAGVGRRVAADRADLERRRVGRVPEAVLGRGLLHLALNAPGWAMATRVTGSMRDLAHPLGGQHDAAFDARSSRRTDPSRRRAAPPARRARSPTAASAWTSAVLLARTTASGPAGIRVAGPVLAVGRRSGPGR